MACGAPAGPVGYSLHQRRGERWVREGVREGDGEREGGMWEESDGRWEKEE